MRFSLDRQMAGVSHRSIASLSVASQSAISLVDMAIRISRSCFSLPTLAAARCRNESVGDVLALVSRYETRSGR